MHTNGIGIKETMVELSKTNFYVQIIIHMSKPVLTCVIFYPFCCCAFYISYCPFLLQYTPIHDALYQLHQYWRFPLLIHNLQTDIYNDNTLLLQHGLYY